ncbi:hypothetical protein [Yinghuangia seranimata]|uniref:hypothetical protein n=1 Tax=Yinghuangia seranimata TaxID=408067 RepID=UPI00248C3371|nr:hypothetical protein [Yinghuangia seranimata]MDI2132389.1 hypothetical protein [Yinghuangia seranimata]
MALHRLAARHVVPFLLLPSAAALVAGCVTVSPRGLSPAPSVTAAAPRVQAAPAATPATPAPAPPDTGSPPHLVWPTPVPTTGADESDDEAEPTRQPPRRPGPQHTATPAPRPSSAPGAALSADVCDGLARYGVFPYGGTAHHWCRQQQPPHRQRPHWATRPTAEVY